LTQLVRFLCSVGRLPASAKLTAMDPNVAKALEIDRSAGARERTVDITTIGRRSGTPRRIETWFHRVDGAVYLTGTPGPRGWAANLEAEPAFTFHLKNGVQADLPAHARQVVDEAERRRILAQLLDMLGDVTDVSRDLDAWVSGSPLFAVEFD
jgi:deazaflavin-dependent oxidoreductase (nitroreductase family)